MFTTWKTDSRATKAASGLFEGYAPEVKRNGRQYLVEHTPYGQIELLPLHGERFLVAAETPPAGAPEFSPALLAAEIVDHLRRHRLKPWCIVAGGEVRPVLADLAARSGSAAETRQGEPEWSPYVFRMAPPPRLVGAARQRLVETLGRLVSARCPGDPFPVLLGPDGVGKRTLMAAAAGSLGLSPIELPLSRIFLDRMLATSQELFLDTLMAAIAYLHDRDLLVVSDADLVARLPTLARRQVLAELGRLRRSCLLADAAGDLTTRVPNMVTLSCPGLKGHREAEELIRVQHPDLEIVGSALTTICRAATVPGVGIVPARLLYLVRLGQSMAVPTGASDSRMFFPDDAAAAVSAGEQAWLEDSHNGPGAADGRGRTTEE